MIGQMIGHYRIIDILGEGGMGIVYKAHDVHLERDVALKILNSQAVNNPQFIERFKREARNQAKLTHQNIVPVYGFTEESHVLGIVMEYVEGETIEQIIEHRVRISTIQALQIIRQVLCGTAYAHSKGFVHRDIKPSNIIVNNEGVAKLMDFGISKSVNDTKGITRTGTKLGTILYMSPEQIKAVEPTNQSDIYSIGITLYEMLSGKNPFDVGTDYQIMEAHLKMNPPRLSTIVGNIGQEIDNIIARALNKSLKKRYASCEEFIDDIDSILENIKPGKEKFISHERTVIPEEQVYYEEPAYIESDPEPLTLTRESQLPPLPPLPKKIPGRKFKFYAFAFLFLVIISGLVLFIYDSISDFWKKEYQKSDMQGLVDSYKLNPAYALNSGWKIINTPSHEQLNSVSFVDNTTGFAVGLNGTLLKTTDSGENWNSILDSTNVFYKLNFYSICFNSLAHGFLAANDGNLVTFDPAAGVFQPVNTGVSESLFDVYFLKNSPVGISVGSGGVIIRTENNGYTWSRVNSPVNVLLYKVFFTDANNGYIAGWNGVVLKTSDKGKTWSQLNQVCDKYLRGVYFIDKETGIVAGGGGEIYRTDNGGKDWELVKSGVTSGLYSVWFFNDKSGIILGSKGEILTSQDAGKSWKVTQSGQYAGLTGLTLTPSRKVFLSGQNGLILTSLK
jgi:serine/threonine-protein kinase